MDLRRLEEAALNAWPALQQMLVGGWVLRFADGYTKRANSINPLYDTGGDLIGRVGLCERLYAERGLPPIFRLTSCLAPLELDSALDRRGYRRIDRSLVLALDLRQQTLPGNVLELRDEPFDEWMALFEQLSGQPHAQRSAHRAIVRSIAPPRLLASGVVGGEAVGCGLGALEGEYFGVFDLLVARGRRGQGYGTALVAAMLRWARERGAAWAYLQVMSANAPARHSYGKLGFAEAYQYWYRVPGS